MAFVSLADLKAGKTGSIAAVAAGTQARARLLALGLLPGEAIEVVSNDGHGPVIVRLAGEDSGERRLALGRGLAMRVLVRETASS